MSSRSIWGFSLRDDDDSDGDDEPTQPRPPAPPARPLSELDLVIASAEPEAETENDDDEAVPDKEREEVDIGAVDEGPIHFVETPFTIASRLAASRKRLANNADSDTAPLPTKPSMSGVKPAAVPESGASNSSTKHLGPLQQGFKRQNEMASSRPPAPKPHKLAKPKATLPIPAAVALDKPEPLPTGASTSHGDEAFRTALSASSSANSASHASGSAKVLPKFAPLRPRIPAPTPRPRPPSTNPPPKIVQASSPPTPTSAPPLDTGDPQDEPASDDGSMHSSTSLFSHAKAGSLLTTHSSSPPPRPSPNFGPTHKQKNASSYTPAPSLDFSRSPSSSPRAPNSVPPRNGFYSSNHSTSFPPPPDRPSPSPLRPQLLSIVSPRLSLRHSAQFSSDQALPPTSFDNTQKASLSSPAYFTSRLPPVTLGPGSVSSSRVPTGPRVIPIHSSLPPTRPQPFHPVRAAPPPPSGLPSIPQRRPPIPLSPFSAAKKPRRGPPHPTSSSPLRPSASPPRWSTLTKNVIPTPSHFGSAVSGPSTTTSTADRFALPGLTMPGGGGNGKGKMAFKPSESLGTFKARRGAESRGSGAEAQELGTLRLGAGLRSVKAPEEIGRKRPRRDETDEERLERVYRGMD